MPPRKLISKDVLLNEKLGGMSYPSLYAKIKRGEFPAGFVLWNNVIKWDEDEVDTFLASRGRQKLMGMEGHKPLPGRKRGRKPRGRPWPAGEPVPE